jgi:hypothetical protein
MKVFLLVLFISKALFSLPGTSSPQPPLISLVSDTINKVRRETTGVKIRFLLLTSAKIAGNRPSFNYFTHFGVDGADAGRIAIAISIPLGGFFIGVP